MAGFFLGLACIVGVGCGGADSEPAEADKLVVIGIDSADWYLLDPLLAEGRLPALAALRAQSASGKMLSFRPLEKSPILWASICTGLSPEDHGIGGFVAGPDQTPLRSNAWRAPGVWDIIGAADRRSAVIGMWNTFPARPIPGVMISDYLTYGGPRGRSLQGLVSPDSLLAAITSLLVTPEQLGLADLERFLGAGDLQRIEQDHPQQIEKLREFYASDLTYLAVARWLAAREDFDLFFFYLRGPDPISHHFWGYFEPEKNSRPPDDEQIAIFGQVVPLYYDFVDEVLAEVLSWFPADRPVMVISDHGFFGSRLWGRGWTHGVGQHSPFGIFMVRSPLYRPGSVFEKLDLLDICPTALGLLGLPPSAEMPGRVLAEGLTVAGRRRVDRFERGRVASYQSLAPAEILAGQEDPEVDEAIRRQLRSLGYIK